MIVDINKSTKAVEVHTERYDVNADISEHPEMKKMVPQSNYTATIY